MKAQRRVFRSRSYCSGLAGRRPSRLGKLVDLKADLGTGRSEDGFQSVAPRRSAADVATDRNELMEGDADRVECVNVLGQPISGSFSFGFERTEEPVPDNENGSVVLVQVLLV